MLTVNSAKRVLMLALLAAAPLAAAADLRITLPVLPPLVETTTRGPLAQLAQAIAREWKEGKATIIGPSRFDHSVEDVAIGKADLHLPMIKSPALDEEELPYRYSTVTLFEVQFVLYTRKGNERTKLMKDLTFSALSKLTLETDPAHTELFDFPIRSEADGIDAALKRVSVGRTDGFLFAMIETDAALKRLGLENIERTPYRRFRVKALLPKGTPGEALDTKLTAVIDRLRATGEYQQIMGSLLTQQFQP